MNTWFFFFDTPSQEKQDQNKGVFFFVILFFLQNSVTFGSQILRKNVFPLKPVCGKKVTKFCSKKNKKLNKTLFLLVFFPFRLAYGRGTFFFCILEVFSTTELSHKFLGKKHVTVFLGTFRIFFLSLLHTI